MAAAAAAAFAALVGFVARVCGTPDEEEEDAAVALGRTGPEAGTFLSACPGAALPFAVVAGTASLWASLGPFVRSGRG